ncbi:MAG: type IV pilus twitching motility protein PilT [Planctomycetota bacterium]
MDSALGVTTANGDRGIGPLLDLCCAREATDMHLVVGEVPWLRIDGRMVRLDDWPRLEAAALADLREELFEASGRVGYDRLGAQDGAITSARGARFRFNVYRRLGGDAIALRWLEDRFRTLGELGLPESLYDLCSLPDGLVAFVGPTGAGKSTTLAALLDRVNQTRSGHVITIEDPIEYVHSSRSCLVSQRQVGLHAAGFHDALVAALREDPDVILLGEVRDLDTMRAAIRAAETGHLVFTTVHAGDCVSAVERLVSVFPGDEQEGVRRQLALVLRAVVAQRLVIADGPRGLAADGVRRERVAVCEVMRVSRAVANLIAMGRGAQLVAAMESGGTLGMQVFEQDLARLCAEGLLTEETANLHARSPEEVRARMNAVRAAPARRGR